MHDRKVPTNLHHLRYGSLRAMSELANLRSEKGREGKESEMPLSLEVFEIDIGNKILKTKVKNWPKGDGLAYYHNYQKVKREGGIQGKRVELVMDHHPEDPKSVLVRVGGLPIGYVPKSDLKTELYDALMAGRVKSLRVTVPTPGEIVREMAKGVPDGKGKRTMSKNDKDILDRQLELNLESVTPRKGYNIRSIRLTKRNNKRADAASWGPNWVGYATPVGVEMEIVDGMRVPGCTFHNVQFSVSNVGGKLVVDWCRTRSDYNDTTHPLHGDKKFLDTITKLLGNMNVLDCFEKQTSLVNVYKCSEGIELLQE
jgi:hypothetical protein